MRPSSAETSEPACVKRKILSTKSNTSCFLDHENILPWYALRRACTRTRWFVHLAKPRCFIDHARLLHFNQRRFFTRTLSTPAKTEASVLGRDITDQPMTITVFRRPLPEVRSSSFKRLKLITFIRQGVPLLSIMMKAGRGRGSGASV